jgi:hypothetical protein
MFHYHICRYFTATLTSIILSNLRLILIMIVLTPAGHIVLTPGHTMVLTLSGWSDTPSFLFLTHLYFAYFL